MGVYFVCLSLSKKPPSTSHTGLLEAERFVQPRLNNGFLTARRIVVGEGAAAPRYRAMTLITNRMRHDIEK
jgi:hypothetical protein